MNHNIMTGRHGVVAAGRGGGRGGACAAAVLRRVADKQPDDYPQVRSLDLLLIDSSST